MKVIETTCADCGENLRIPASDAGKIVRCPHCKEVLTIPSYLAMNAFNVDPEISPEVRATRNPVKALFLLAILFLMWKSCQPGDRHDAIDWTDPNSTAQSLSGAENSLGGNGYDWLRLSDKAKLELCMQLETRLGVHDAWYYREFLGTYYGNAQGNDRTLLDTPITEVAAVAAAIK